MAILSMIPEGDPDLITYLTELLRTKKPDQQTINFWFPTPETSQHRRSHPNSDRNPKRTARIAAKRETESKRWH